MTIQLSNNTQHAKPRRPKLSVGLAQSEREIIEAQKLRFRIFAGELGATLPTRTPGVDHDIYDPYCEHLVVRDDQSGAVVGTYRILSPTHLIDRCSGYRSPCRSACRCAAQLC